MKKETFSAQYCNKYYKTLRQQQRLTQMINSIPGWLYKVFKLFLSSIVVTIYMAYFILIDTGE